MLSLSRCIGAAFAMCLLPAAASARDEASRQTVSAEATDGEKPLSAGDLSDALSCRSGTAAVAFASALFLDGKPPRWMHPLDDKEMPEAMVGLYGYRLAEPVSLFGSKIDKVYFLKEWVVALLPRTQAEILIRQQGMERAPIEAAEQYFRFIDAGSGPMLGAFEPTGNAMAAAFATAMGGDKPAKPPSETLFVGCNYAPVSQADFLQAVAEADALIEEIAAETVKPAR